MGKFHLGIRVLNLLVGLVDGLTRLLGYRLMVVLDDHQIDVKVIAPDSSDEIAYDDNHYVNGNIFLKGYANPIKLKLDKAKKEVALISSERYKYFMRMNLVKDIIRSTEGGGWSLETMVKIMLILLLVNTGFIVFFVVLLIGGL